VLAGAGAEAEDSIAELEDRLELPLSRVAP
jgi:hypothetical protein